MAVTMNNTTVRELKKLIRAATVEVNERIVEYRSKVEAGQMKRYKILETQIRHMRETAGTKGRWGEIGVGVGGKRKATLMYQYQQLASFLDSWDIYTPEGLRREEERTKRAYEKFNRTVFGNYSFDEWYDYVQVFGTIGKELTEMYGSENIIELASHLDKRQMRILPERLISVYHRYRREGLTVEELLDRVYEEFGM